mmetsp:Transcript_72078/g.150580  ORF Transcript_72078/g.150580 Transcript_72078/m.150580 type:complete len:566 (-) Transcript_72078:64-1761(-)|eukprot:CAMPEP_0206509612 /NCGR_PEP_ID=MMETSP0324_2-20121206/59040_1 /ASSEMBLY_ACC=CAM_ASM_000836 /TAXON_ID=2866 /ORGANISM="Crypthecodinium cohnii, Strain Seligo" /LENGTH=565 /DNA_ID=CAMNT_0054000717 /DNA_START=55 /DNA_END=1752 /DNA_ORIENTATION=-
MGGTHGCRCCYSPKDTLKDDSANVMENGWATSTDVVDLVSKLGCHSGRVHAMPAVGLSDKGFAALAGQGNGRECSAWRSEVESPPPPQTPVSQSAPRKVAACTSCFEEASLTFCDHPESPVAPLYEDDGVDTFPPSSPQMRGLFSCLTLSGSLTSKRHRSSSGRLSPFASKELHLPSDEEVLPNVALDQVSLGSAAAVTPALTPATTHALSVPRLALGSFGLGSTRTSRTSGSEEDVSMPTQLLASEANTVVANCETPKTILDGQFDPSGLRRPGEVTLSEQNWESSFSWEKELGKGGFGVVSLVRRKQDGKRFAMKTLEVTRMSDYGRFEREFEISSQMAHPNIVGLHRLYKQEGKFFLVMDLCTGGDLHSKVVATHVKLANKVFGGFTTRQVVQYAWQMLSGLAYLHHYRFAHRDIKLENYMLESDRDNAQLRLIDFGLARQFKKGELMRTKVGTPSYCAPEVFAGDGYDERLDVWSVGVSLFVASCSILPFTGRTDAETFDHARNNAHEYDDVNWERHPQPLRDIIDLMLSKSFYDRPTATALLENEWLQRTKMPSSCCAIS